MRSGTQVYGPDELKILQQIVESVLEQLSRRAAYRKVDRAALRRRISRQVFKYAKRDVLSVDAIRQAVLATFHN